MHCKYKIATLTAALALACITPTSRADEAPKIQRKILLKEDTSIAGHEGLMVRVEIPPGAAEGYHTHPADAFAFILEGETALEMAGKPTVTLKAGDVFHIPAGVVHQGINKGSVPVKLAVVFVTEKGKPLTVPVK